MRVRRLFWVICTIACFSIMYVMIGLGFNAPKLKPATPEIDDSKWASFEDKLQRIEGDMRQHHAVVAEIKSVMSQMSDQEYEEPEPPEKDAQPPVKDVQPPVKDSSLREAKVVGDEPPRMKPAKTVKAIDTAMCPIQKGTVPKTDIQMLSLYERMMFDDKDGGAWKQGWNVEYSDKQWSQHNKLKVFIVPHSHNDPGWLKTFEEYYKSQTRTIFTNMVEKLQEGHGRKFIWAETSFLALWWTTDATAKEKADFQRLLNSGNIEIVTGGWVMNDEANAHWLSAAQQLTTGHQWLLDNLEYLPKNAWSIDPFGHSSSQPYLLKLAGFDNSVIQRVHYRVKKELALSRQLEFKWRQLWDGEGKTDMFTHMMPFYSYDVPHTCGPDPKICCQFDFRRLPGGGMTCPWGVAPRKIIQKNVAERSSVILDQWRKKAQLYRSNSVLVPLGDDFRYDRASEWDHQYQNYDMIIDYINNNEAWNAEVQFATLQDYFKSVHEELSPTELPVLSGDFFTYADRGQHYWSGYYTSRPFYKSMDRVLLAYVRAAETITAQAALTKSVSGVLSLSLRDRVEAARRSLALFQHHDGVTGTSRDDVTTDYAKKLLQAIKHCQSAIQQAAYHLLRQPTILEQIQDDVYFDVDDIWRQHNEIPSRITIALDAMSPARRVVLYNALSFERHEIVTVLVSSVHVEVYDPEGNPIMSQISPVVAGERRLGFANNKFQLSFLATVAPLALVAYSVQLRDATAINKYTSYSRVRVYNADYWTVDLPAVFAVSQPQARLDSDVTVQAGNGTRLVANMNGLIKTVVSREGTVTPVHMDFVHYGTSHGRDMNSGAYLFLPGGAASPLRPAPYPELVALEGPLRAALYVALAQEKHAEIIMAISVNNNPTLPHSEVEITNTFLIDPQAADLELAMRFSTSIANGDVFYTDVNGMQMIKRRYFDKIPLQANFYPLPAAAYIEDAATRLTLLTSSPLGVAALSPGQIEVMQDRRLSRDDNRGVNQGVQDNVRTRHTFRLLVESAASCHTKTPPEHPSGQLTVGAHVAQQTLLQPLITMHYSANQEAERANFTPLDKGKPIGVDVVLASFRSHVSAKSKSGAISRGLGVTLQRVSLDSCYGSRDLLLWYPLGDGQVSVPFLTGGVVPAARVLPASLSYTRLRGGGGAGAGLLRLCPGEVRAVFLNHTTH